MAGVGDYDGGGHEQWPAVWRAVPATKQMSITRSSKPVINISARAGTQEFHRAISGVNGGREQNRICSRG